MADTALVVVDMLNTYEHEDADKLTRSVREVLPNIVDLVERATDDDDVEVVYVNDLYGHWNAGRTELLERVMEGGYRELVEPIAPAEDALFVVKARHSIFYETPLEYMMRQQGTARPSDRAPRRRIATVRRGPWLRHCPPPARGARHPRCTASWPHGEWRSTMYCYAAAEDEGASASPSGIARTMWPRDTAM
jgi:hypothetical protein